ncbi:hypothetical protein J1N35_016014 [Gossypium stocksii]|uniref:CCHC-type domain-containing protein n=1 Tax=Gossypium stocksii TaxID=47602 RepID=A0A9D4A940_9ROSI|nr:hypothetical protein J1N35_016014 [Gossypium stocksii]
MHEGHSSVTDYLTKIKKLCDLLAASGNPVSNDEQVGIVLVGLSVNFEAVVTVASLAPELLKMDQLVDILLECENRQQRFVLGTPVQANLVHHSSASSSLASPSDSISFQWSDRAFFRGRGRSSRGCFQCQICGRLGYLAQRCYYRFDQSFDGIPVNGHSRSPRDFSVDESAANGETGPVTNQVTYLPQPNVFGFGPTAVFGPSSQSIGHIVCAGSCGFPSARLSRGTAPSCASVGPLSRSALGNTGAMSFSPGSVHFHTDSGSSHFHVNGPSVFHTVRPNASGSGSGFGSLVAHSTRLVLPPTFSARPYVSLPQPSAEPFVWHADSGVTNHIC